MSAITGEGVVQCGNFLDKGRPHFLAQKTSDFSKFMVWGGPFS